MVFWSMIFQESEEWMIQMKKGVQHNLTGKLMKHGMPMMTSRKGGLPVAREIFVIMMLGGRDITRS